MSRADDHYEHWWHDRTDNIGLATALDARLVYQTISPHHQIEVLRHDGLGWVISIDGALHAVEKETAEREMRIHVPLLGKVRRHCRVLLLGGGDGAVLHEILRHSFVTDVLLSEPDEALIRVGVDHLGFAEDLRDRRVRVRDLAPLEALAFAREHEGPFDVIVLEWPAIRLPWQADGKLDELSRGLAGCLAEDGVCVDSDRIVLGVRGSHWYRDALPTVPGLPGAIQGTGRFGPVQRYYAATQLAAGGFIGFFLYPRDAHSYREPQCDFSGSYYNPGLHRAAFALPSFAVELTGARDALVERPAGNHSDPSGWWHEQTFGSGITQALDMRRVHLVRSEFQEIEVYDHHVYGRVLVLDGTVQLSQADEFIYHEMAVHVPLLGRRRSGGKALIIGGGDGGILREILKHPWVESVTMVEIDRTVVEVSNSYIGVEGDYEDARANVLFADGVEYMAQAAHAGERFDLIVVDATDSTSPSKTLWSERFYENLAACLAEDGVCVDSDILTWADGRAHLSRDPCDVSVFDIARSSRYFARVESYFTKVPLYPAGYFAFFLYTKDGRSHAVPERDYLGRYYNPALHRAAFALPTWWEALMNRAGEELLSTRGVGI
jgi:spermidine synthase